MLPELHKFGKELYLVMNSGIQFVDFGMNIDWKDKYWKEKSVGYFIPSGGHGALRRLVPLRNGEGFADVLNPNTDISSKVKDDHIVSVSDSFKLFNNVWLPIPVLRTVPPSPDHQNTRFDEGPYNWARLRIVQLDSPDEQGNTHRLTFAFDTKVFPNNDNTAYLAPTAEDVRAGALFSLAHRADHIGWFLDQKWVNDWLVELFKELAPRPDRLKLQDIEELDAAIENKSYQAHYLNILATLGGETILPECKILSNKADDITPAIPVDLVLDVGNSRTCGILIEEHVQDKDGLKKRYELELRDLNRPEFCYREPFESRVEFAQAFFGKDHFSVQSGRRDAFLWPSLVRVGKEASRLASRREGNEGSTGLSSPKRYLWDTAQYEQGWRFNSSYVKNDHEPFATAEPMSGLINEYGEALYSLSDEVEEEFERKMPVFQPKYSRSSLMTFMLAEVLMHALMQMNSPTQRAKQEHSRVARYLRSITLTIPPAMPKPERSLFRRSVEQAVGLIWKCLEWDNSDNDVVFKTAADRNKYWPPLPEVLIEWDEATCGQIVYLYTETQNNYGGRPEEFIRTMVRPDKQDKDSLTVATIDIGGGTTDLIINDYSLDYGSNANKAGSNVYIVPTQRFRDGFKVAGDDILLDIIRTIVLPSLTQRLQQLGLKDPDPILSDLIGTEASGKVQNAILKQQLNLQIFTQIGLSILKAYENYEPFSDDSGLIHSTFRELLDDAETPTDNVLNYINDPLTRALPQSEFNILDVPIQVNLKKLHGLFIRGNSFDICKTFQALCEVVNSYQCDVLLLTGRPSRLPGVQAFFKSRLPLPAGRILSMHHYRTGNWFPFHKQGRIDDPKTTAAVGAMLCFLSKDARRLPNFYFRAADMKSYSTIKYIGQLDHNNVIKDANVYYKDINLDNEDYDFPDDTTFEVRGPMRIGFRQLNVERWTASPLYVLTIEDQKLGEALGAGNILNVGIRLKRNKNIEDFEISSASFADSNAVSNPKSKIKLQLNTMVDAGLGESQYWLDTGSIKR